VAARGPRLLTMREEAAPPLALDAPATPAEQVAPMCVVQADGDVEMLAPLARAPTTQATAAQARPRRATAQAVQDPWPAQMEV